MMPARSDSTARKLTPIRRLFYFNAFIWFCLGAYLVLEMVSFHNTLSSVLLGFFMVMNAAGMFFSGYLLDRRNRWIYLITLMFLLVNILLTFTDQFGWMDLLILILDLVIFGMLASLRGVYLRRS